MHDSITQYLYSLNLLAEAGQAQMETGATSAIGNTFAQIGRTARQAIKEIRLFIQQLRPAALEQVGLVGALHQRLACVEGRANVQTRLLVNEAIILPVQVEDALYYIASEALNNTLRHANADTVTVHLRLEGDTVVLEVVDNGRGFNPTPARPAPPGKQRGTSQTARDFANGVRSPGSDCVRDDREALPDGNGMGLGSMRERANLVGGTVQIVSTPDTGTVVRVIVPVGQPPRPRGGNGGLPQPASAEGDKPHA